MGDPRHDSPPRSGWQGRLPGARGVAASIALSFRLDTSPKPIRTPSGRARSSEPTDVETQAAAVSARPGRGHARRGMEPCAHRVKSFISARRLVRMHQSVLQQTSAKSFKPRALNRRRSRLITRWLSRGRGRRSRDGQRPEPLTRARSSSSVTRVRCVDRRLAL